MRTWSDPVYTGDRTGGGGGKQGAPGQNQYIRGICVNKHIQYINSSKQYII